MTQFSRGRFAKFISDRSGLAFPYTEMVVEWTGARVHTSEFEPKSAQVSPRPHGADPQALPFAEEVFVAAFIIAPMPLVINVIMILDNKFVELCNY